MTPNNNNSNRFFGRNSSHRRGAAASCSCASGGTCGSLRHHDIFAYNPTYEWTSHKTLFGAALSYLCVGFVLFYVVLTTRDYAVMPPELVSRGDIDLLQVAREIPFRIPRVGLRVGYSNVTAGGYGNDGSDDHDRVSALENENPYIRYRFRHVVYRNQRRVDETELQTQNCVVGSVESLCPVLTPSAASNSDSDSEKYKLLGTYHKEDYQFLEISVDKCVGSPNCAPIQEINDKIRSGEFRIRAVVGVESEQFDVERYHATGSGMAIVNRSYEYFGLPDVELQSDIYVQARIISKEQRYAGSPPVPETEIRVLTLQRRETNFRPRSSSEANLMTFAIRLSDSVKLEELSWWCPSILDLFGLWGAMASFAASLSLGFLALQYNRWHFHRHFQRAARQKRLDAQRETMSAMEFIRNKRKMKKDEGGDSTGGPGAPDGNRREEVMYDSLQAQYDALLVEPDLRLYETHHFDPEGRVTMSPAELKYPSTAFGELRRLAVLEHGRKKRAAQFLSVWYGRHLVRRGFIKDEGRCRELFSSPWSCGEQPSNISLPFAMQKIVNGSKRQKKCGRFTLAPFRRRKKGSRRASNGLSLKEEDVGTNVYEDSDIGNMEDGIVNGGRNRICDDSELSLRGSCANRVSSDARNSPCQGGGRSTADVEDEMREAADSTAKLDFGADAV